MEDERAQKKDICRVTKTIGRIEWICVKPVHGKVYERRVGDQTHTRGDPIFSTNPSVDWHYFVNKWPNRKE